MQTEYDIVVKAFEGMTKLAQALEAPPSTVYSWRKSGIPASRMAHIRLVARERGIALPDRAA